MKGNYLVCKRCNGYYELGEGESPDDFEFCQCGGELILVHDINEYVYHGGGKKQASRLNKTNLFLISVVILLPLIIFFNTSLLYIPQQSSMEGHNIIGSDNRGYVLKDVYGGSNGDSVETMAIVTGMHPRETLSKKVTSDLIAKYPLGADKKMVHYDIKVTKNPTDFTAGRNNGEGLAADYILPDILKSNSDLVIICHDHEPSYGKGFYIATPEMDAPSVKLAESVNKSIPGFRYYRADNVRKSSASAIKFSKPLASAGYKTFVYEIPEWVSYNEAYSMTRTFIDKSFSFI